MPISVVVGGQYGSEGKGKVALELVRRNLNITIAVRPGGTNSGHTGYSKDGRRVVLRQLPAAAIDGTVKVVLPPGSYIDLDLFVREVAQLRLPPSQVAVDPRAHVITSGHIDWEKEAGLSSSIGSTGSGTGAAVLSRFARGAAPLPNATPASAADELAPYLTDTALLLHEALSAGERVLVEGTQGFGLSPIHGDSWPNCTSRDTTAAGLLSEAGLSPTDVDEVVLVLRSHPIRVSGNSGPIPNETSWEEVARKAGAPNSLVELTSVTKKIRRIGFFDAGVVNKAIIANRPTKVVLNHVDYIDWSSRHGTPSARAVAFIRDVEDRINRKVDMVGLNEFDTIDAADVLGPARRVA